MYSFLPYSRASGCKYHDQRNQCYNGNRGIWCSSHGFILSIFT